MFYKITKIIILLIITTTIILLLAYGVSKSSFNNLKKYDEKDTSMVDARNAMQNPSKEKRQLAEERYYTTTVKIRKGDMANLGDFTMNIHGDKKLTANISLKYKNNKGNNWLIDQSVEDEIVEKADVLRSAVVSTISGRKNTRVSNDKMKKELIKNMNKYLSEGEIEEVYFNRFIIQ